MTLATRRLLGGGTLTGLLVLAAVLVWIFAKTDRIKPDPGDAALVARGRAVYAQHCASCHGANLEGQPNWRERLPNGRLPAPPHDASGHTWHHSDNQLFEMVKNGTAGIAPGYETDMPSYKGVLSDGDIWAALSFIESSWPSDVRERQQRLGRSNR